MIRVLSGPFLSRNLTEYCTPFVYVPIHIMVNQQATTMIRGLWAIPKARPMTQKTMVFRNHGFQNIGYV